jgi:hypothetical protein
MANPTSNYGFVMPQNTDLVKDLPADFDIFGQAVDDRIKALNPETTAGDISYRGGTANAKTRLAIGTAGQVLAVNSGATAPEWKTMGAAGISLINRSTFSNVASHAVDNVFTSSYKSYVIVIEQIYSSSANDIDFQFRYGGSSGTTDTAATHYYHTAIGLFNSTSLATSLAGNGTTLIRIGGNVGTSTYPFSSNINVSNVGNAAEYPSINYIGHNAGGSPGFNMGAGTLFSSRTFTGFLLKSSTNITGAVAVYGYGV